MNKFVVATICLLLTTPVFAEPGFAVQVVGGRGYNTDDMATDFDGGHSIAAVEAAYRLRTGTELALTAGLGAGGHEAVFATWGAAVRQRLTLDRMEPFVTLGVYEVGDDVRLPPALGVGGGLDVRIERRLFAGIEALHYFSDDSDTIGGLDWSFTAHVGFRL